MIQTIRLQHFRSYDDESFEFGPGVNIIVGPNASGKTNLLESILVLARGSSYRAIDSELVQFAQDWSRLDAIVNDDQRSVKIRLIPQSDKSYEIAGRVFKRLSLPYTLPLVLFEPNHLRLLHGSPQQRREYLDELLTQLLPGFGTTIRDYRRTLAQRNNLLKRNATMEQFFPWNIRLSELAGKLVRARLQLVWTMQSRIGELYRELSNTNLPATLAYRTLALPEEYESHMLHHLERRLSDDLRRGFTTFGPHREDLEVRLDNHMASVAASRGETRTLVLVLKIIELHLLKERRKQMPILLLDDVFSELDGTRRKALTQHLASYQTFITTTDADVVLPHLAEPGNVIRI